MRNDAGPWVVGFALLLACGAAAPARTARAQQLPPDPEKIEAEAEPDDPANVGNPLEEEVEDEDPAVVDEDAGAGGPKTELAGDENGRGAEQPADDDDVVIVGNEHDTDDAAGAGQDSADDTAEQMPDADGSAGSMRR